MTSGEAAREAATVVILRDGPAGPEALMLRRSQDSPAFPGMWVFPGGTVSDEDRRMADPLRAAAVREAAEECGLRLAADELMPLSQWTPPSHARHRFRTSFFAVRVDVDQDVVIDDFEVVDHDWVRPEVALQRHAAGSWDFLPPTWVTLARLTAVTAASDLRTGPVEVFDSQVVGREPTTLGWAGDERHPDQPGSPGARHRLTLGERPWRYENTTEGAVQWQTA